MWIEAVAAFVTLETAMEKAAHLYRSAIVWWYGGGCGETKMIEDAEESKRDEPLFDEFHPPAQPVVLRHLKHGNVIYVPE